MLISEEYRSLNQRMHEAMPSWGSNTHDMSWMAPYIKGYKSLLDYGCGKGRLNFPGLDYRKYDPAVPEFADPPQAAELVLCASVMEHVERDCLDNVLDHIRALATRRVVFKVSTFDTDLRLADHSSPHRIVESADWWARKLLDRWSLIYAMTMPRGLRFIGDVEPFAGGN